MYARGTWYDNDEMPADKTRYGAFSGLTERSEDDVKSITHQRYLVPLHSYLII
ncbi:hypothetical protein PSDI105340_01095 [Pseudoalteromonas distincta]